MEVVVYKKQDLMTVSDVARRWGVSRKKIYDMIDDGTLSAFRFGFSKRLHIPMRSIREQENGVVYTP